MLHLSNKQEVTKVCVSYLNLTFAEKQQVIPVKKMKKIFPSLSHFPFLRGAFYREVSEQ